ncbi:MAG: NAD(P)-dependent alcohol dehydrogenase [Chloroflexi bacterium]|nr:NAD(P)-dependent alcohol dehydrogenase [Chloroflexota bacterium]
MKAAVCTKYGPPDVVQIQDVAKPTPKDDQVLVKIHATTVTSGDSRIRGLNVPAGFGPITRLMFGFRKPRNPILGTELSGEIEAVGKDVTTFKVGDQVFGSSGFSSGAHAEYICLRAAGGLAPKPANLSFEEAAAVSFGGTTALYYLRDLGKIQRGHKVLVVGASGSVGTSTVQFAKHFGAEVTGVCSTANVELVKSLGADHVIDYTQEDFTQNGQTYDLIVDTVGVAPFSKCKDSLVPKGKLLLVVAGLPQFAQVMWTSLFSSKKVAAGVASEKPEDLLLIKELLEAGTLKPVIDRTFPLDQIAAAHRYVDTGRKKGNVVITVTGTNGR